MAIGGQSEAPKQRPGRHLSPDEFNKLGPMLKGLVRPGPGLVMQQVGTQVVISLAEGQIIPRGASGGLNIASAANKTALDLLAPGRTPPDLGWTQDEEVLYFLKAGSPPTWNAVSHWRPWAGP